MTDSTKAQASAAADIVAEVVALVPPPTALVPELVKAQLPEVISEDRTKNISASDHLVDLLITGTLSDVRGGPIPHRTWLASQ